LIHKTIKKSEIQALITLLDDPDVTISETVSKKLIEMGRGVIADLEKVWETTINEQMQSKLEILIQDIQFNDIQQTLIDWRDHESENLLKGAYIIACFQYPELKFERLTEELEKIRKDIWIELNDNLTALEKVRVFNHIMYEIHGFSGNTDNYYSPQNYYINQVLETKKGNPVSLAIIYSTLALKLDIPIYGVNLPKNFILAYKDKYAISKEDDILFYINPYNRGSVLGKREIDYFLKQQNIPPDTSYYNPCSNIIIIQRLLVNLISSYETIGQQDKIIRLKQLLDLFG